MQTKWKKPVEGEYIPYQKTYFDQVPDGDLIDLLQQNIDETAKLIASLTEEQGNHSYAPGKWTLKQVINHICDCERVMAYRALCIARGEQQSLPGFEQDDYVALANTDERKLVDMLGELISIRAGSLTLLHSFNEEILARKGQANNHTVTVNALCYVIAGHEVHHMRIIREKYLNGKSD